MPLLRELKTVLVIGSGPIVIGQAAEFDYAGTQACIALKEEGIKVILLNSNPATIMTDESIADKVYIEPMTVEAIEEIIKKEKPDGLIGTLGGQTGLNLTVKLHEQKILEKYGVTLLGTSVESIQNGEDREKFRNLMHKIDEPVPESVIVHSFKEGYDFVKRIGYPVIIRPAYTLGGDGGGFAYNDEEFEAVIKKGLNASPINQVLVERSIKGWKEVEYEVMRDANDTCIIVCNMENMDPVGVHTGDSIVVAPSQTLNDVQYQMLRDSSVKVIRELGIIGGCNIQFALDPNSNQYYIIEVNPRVSRSSALASKATGYPIARIAAKCSVGYHLDEIINPITGNTFASFEPALDYIVVKLPRFPFDKFPEADRILGTQMKATGEVMAIDRTFEGALNKAIRSLEMNIYGLTSSASKIENLNEYLMKPTDLRLFAIVKGMLHGLTIEEIHQITDIDTWFLNKIQTIVELEQKLSSFTFESVPKSLLLLAKKMNISDKFLASIYGVSEKTIRSQWKEWNWKPGYKMVDTCAAEFDAITPYFYSTWQGTDEVEVNSNRKILVIGSGPIRIGQGIEFDYCSVHAAEAIKEKGIEAIVINNNPETVSTDYSIADKLYFEPLATEDVLNVIEKEQVEGVFIQFGGQTAINLAKALSEEGVNLLGTSVGSIDQLEDRQQFYHLLKELDIPHIEGETAKTKEELLDIAENATYPVLVRPSYVIGGQSMFTFFHKDELKEYCKQLNSDQIWPLLVDRYVPGLECEIDCLSDGENIIVPGIFEHVEKAGVHSGDSISIFPAVSFSEEVKETMINYAEKIAKAALIVGIMNIQYVIHEEKVYVLEVNPRSSRTVPILSKVTRVPMIEWATYVQIGYSLKDLSTEVGLLKAPGYFSVKAPIFSSSKLKGVDYSLGPEMKSTGEVLGIGYTLEEALGKVLIVDGKNPLVQSEKAILCSISNRTKKESLEVIQELAHKNVKIIATKGTATFLKENGIFIESIIENELQLTEYLKNNQIASIINIATKGRNHERFGFNIRELAIRYNVPCYTNLETVKQMLCLQKGYANVHTIAELNLREVIS